MPDMSGGNIPIVSSHQNVDINSNESVTPNQSINELSTVLKLTITSDSNISEIFVKALSIITDFLMTISVQLYADFSA
jgi:hypothetical protein